MSTTGSFLALTEGASMSVVAGQPLGVRLHNKPGNVELRGRVQLTTGTFAAATDVLVTTLPLDLRPNREHLLSAAIIDNDGTTLLPCVLKIGTDGTVNAQGTGATNKTVSVDGVLYPLGFD